MARVTQLPPPGLVLSAKTRAEPSTGRFPGGEAVGAAAAGIRSASLAHGAGGLFVDQARNDVGNEGPRWFVTVSPGSIRVSSTDLARGQRRQERAVATHAFEMTEQVGELIGDEFTNALYQGGLVDEPAPNRERLPSRIITEWSPKSRLNMTKSLMTLDYNQLIKQGELAMMTLTYPDNWESLVADGRVFKTHVDKLRNRFLKRYGFSISGVWKMEFQRRGAPHLHVLIALPESMDSFRKWIRSAWAEIVGAEGMDRFNHELAGVNVDQPPRPMTDPKRIGVYFSKHGVWGSKEYQNRPPQLWIDAAENGESVGRFWGYWKLERVEVPVMVTGDEAKAISRALRRWSEAGQRAMIREDGTQLPVDGQHLRIPVREAMAWRKQHKLDCETGEMVFWRFRKRKVRRRIRRMRGTAGFLAVNAGPSAAFMIERVVRGRL